MTAAESDAITLFAKLGCDCSTDVGTGAEDKSNEVRRRHRLFCLEVLYVREDCSIPLPSFASFISVGLDYENIRRSSREFLHEIHSR